MSDSRVDTGGGAGVVVVVLNDIKPLSPAAPLEILIKVG